MKTRFKKINPPIILFLFILSLSIFLRFFNLNWGEPYFFHPDERNIASSISELKFPEEMNPHFFAYGTAPIYTAYFIGIAGNYIANIIEPIPDLLSVRFEQAILILRVISALLSIFIIYLIFDLIKKSLGEKYAVLAASLAGLNVGLIQYSHFGTFEIWLSAFSLLICKFCFDYLNSRNKIWLIYMAIVFGVLLSIKVSSIIILPIITTTIVVNKFKTRKDFKKVSNYINAVALLLITILISISIFTIFFPFAFIDFKSFFESMNYESSVALGTMKVFYTGGFENTVPIIYQLLYVYPYIFNPINFLLFIFLLPFVVKRLFKEKENLLILSIVFFLAIFLSQAFFYVKWIRYYIPTIPFLLIVMIFGIKSFAESFKKEKRYLIFSTLFVVLIISALIFSLSYFKTVLFDKDTRIVASEFAEKNLSSNSKIISEVYDLGIITFNNNFPNITLFDFYALDDGFQKKTKKDELEELIFKSDYLILPSQRLIRNRIINKEYFSEGYKFYKDLDSKFNLIYKTPCDIFCKILYLGDPIYATEETADIFDRPTIYIYEITKE